jgi:leader peptidase (prepilin peptidase)/N-methyltransferase
MTIYYGVCVALFGLIFGSFLNCTAMRLVRGEDFVRGRSKCPKCGRELTAIELIPVVSFVIQRGKCRHCGEKISPRYIAAEIAFAVLSLGLYIKLILGGGLFDAEQLLIFFRNWGVTGCLFVVTLTDLESMEIYDGVLIFGLLNFVAFAIVQAFLGFVGFKFLGLSVLSGIVTGAVMLFLSLLMDKILKKDSLGGGDIKLYALLGVYLGFFGAYELLILSCVLGLIYVGIRKLLDPSASKEFAFGPALALAGYILLLTEEYITGWYLSLIGM